MLKEPLQKQKNTKPIKNKEEIIETKIPQDKLKEFVGPVDNLLKVSATHLWDDRFRVNVWTEKYRENSICPDIKIDKTFFVHYNDGMIIDHTIQPKLEEERIF